MKPQISPHVLDIFHMSYVERMFEYAIALLNIKRQAKKHSVGSNHDIITRFSMQREKIAQSFVHLPPSFSDCPCSI